VPGRAPASSRTACGTPLLCTHRGYRRRRKTTVRTRGRNRPAEDEPQRWAPRTRSATPLVQPARRPESSLGTVLGIPSDRHFLTAVPVLAPGESPDHGQTITASPESLKARHPKR
jgi:hypothetical protein